MNTKMFTYWLGSMDQVVNQLAYCVRQQLPNFNGYLICPTLRLRETFQWSSATSARSRPVG